MWMSISQNISGGYPMGFTVTSFSSMFIHAAAMGQKEHDCAICHGRWEPLPVWDLEAEPSVVELTCANSTREDIAKIDQDVYQLWWLLGKDPVMWRKRTISTRKSWIPSRNASSISGILHHWRNWYAPYAPSGVKTKADYTTQNCANYDWLKDTTQGSCEEALVVARDAKMWLYWTCWVNLVGSPSCSLSRIHYFAPKGCGPCHSNTRFDRCRVARYPADLQATKAHLLKMFRITLSTYS